MNKQIQSLITTTLRNQAIRPQLYSLAKTTTPSTLNTATMAVIPRSNYSTMNAARRQKADPRKVDAFACPNNWRKSMATLFNSEKHLAYTKLPAVHTMESLSLPDIGVSPIAVSEPFPLFSEEAVEIMRSEALSEVVQKEHFFGCDLAPKQLRGYARSHAKFSFEAWSHPEVTKIVSEIAGVELVHNIDYDIGHINVSIPGKKLQHKTVPEHERDVVVGWHKDSYPFVCVLMLSDTAGMVGGETAIKTGTGEILKVKSPSKGCAVVMQGRYLDHAALPTLGGKERITMVTSFRPRSPFVRDDTRLTTVRPTSHIPELYGQIAEYQLENTESRVRHVLKMVREDMRSGRVNVKAIKQFLEFEVAQLGILNREMVEEHLVKMGFVADAVAEERAREEAMEAWA